LAAYFRIFFPYAAQCVTHRFLAFPIITDSDMPIAIRGRLEKLGIEVRYV
jgi:hypothetical protein